jgi:hypothetical protein
LMQGEEEPNDDDRSENRAKDAGPARLIDQRWQIADRARRKFRLGALSSPTGIQTRRYELSGRNRIAPLPLIPAKNTSVSKSLEFGWRWLLW